MDEHIRILFIDDQPNDMELTCSRLREAGIQPEWRGVDTETGIRQALEDFHPQIVLCDYRIPGYSGRAALEFVHTAEPLLPFLFVSGTIGEEMAVECLRDGATDCILKGDPHRLSSAVLRAVSAAQLRLKASEIDAERGQLAQFVEATSDMVVLTDTQNNVTFINKSGCRLLGGQREDWIGRGLDRMFPTASRQTVFATALPAALRLGSWSGETSITTLTGEEIPLSQVITAHSGADGGVHFFSTIARDIRGRRDYEERIHYLSLFDALTGLPNDTLLADRATQALAHAKRVGRLAAIVAISLDEWLVQQTPGRSMADRVLIDVSAQWRASVRECDTVARTGPNEFCVLLADLNRAEDAATVVEKLLAGGGGPAPPLPPGGGVPRPRRGGGLWGGGGRQHAGAPCDRRQAQFEIGSTCALPLSLRPCDRRSPAPPATGIRPATRSAAR